MKINFGIDFGTTSSSICYFNNITKKYTLLNKNNSKKIASKIYSYNNKYFTKKADNFKEISHFKRDINKINFNNDNLELKNITKVFIEYLKDIINNNFRITENINSVFTVPTSYNHFHRSWYKNILEEVGFNVSRIISEPSSAAIAYYTLNHERDILNEDDKILVIDLGGGTTDISLLEKDGSFYQVIYNKGDLYLGGEDFTKEMSSMLNISLKEAEERKLKNNNEDKKYYSKSLKRLENLIKSIKREAKEYLEEIMDVILVGNGLKLIGILDLLDEEFPNKIRTSEEQEYLVGYGAGIISNELNNASSELIIVDSTSLSLGIETIDLNFSIIIPSNSPLPASGIRKYLPSDDNEREITLRIYQGEHCLAEDNEIVGELIVPANPKIFIDSIYQIKLVLDLNGIIYVKIKDLSDKDYSYDRILKFRKSDNIEDLKRSEKDNSNEREVRRLKYEIRYNITQILYSLEETDLPREDKEMIKEELDELLEKSVDYVSCIKYKDILDTKYSHLQFTKIREAFDEENNLASEAKDYSDNLTNKYLKDKLRNYLDLEIIINSLDLKNMVENLLENYDDYDMIDIRDKIAEIDSVLETETPYKEFRELILTIEYEVESNNLELNDLQKSLILERITLEKEFISEEKNIDYEKKINSFNEFCEKLINL